MPHMWRSALIWKFQKSNIDLSINIIIVQFVWVSHLHRLQLAALPGPARWFYCLAFDYDSSLARWKWKCSVELNRKGNDHKLFGHHLLCVAVVAGLWWRSTTTVTMPISISAIAPLIMLVAFIIIVATLIDIITIWIRTSTTTSIDSVSAQWTTVASTPITVHVRVWTASMACRKCIKNACDAIFMRCLVKSKHRQPHIHIDRMLYIHMDLNRDDRRVLCFSIFDVVDELEIERNIN